MVKAADGTRRPAFDHERLAGAIRDAVGVEHPPTALPSQAVTFADGGQSLTFQMGGHLWSCDLANYVLTKGKAVNRRPVTISPLRAFVWGHNAAIRVGDRFVPVSRDGTEAKPYARVRSSPDLKTAIAFRAVEMPEYHSAYLIESSPSGGGLPKLTAHTSVSAGDQLTSIEMNIFRLGDLNVHIERSDRYEFKLKTVDRLKPNVGRFNFTVPQIRWIDGGRAFVYEQVDRGHQRLRVVRVDVRSGEARTLIDERSETFIWTALPNYIGVPRVTWLGKSNEFIYMTERDGRRHLYLYDAETGEGKNLITPGDLVVRGIDYVDQEARQLWFRACGGVPGQDPYFIHYYRVNFDGTGLTALTAGDGTHSVQFSPGRKYLIDTYSRANMPPVHELRRGADGGLICVLEGCDSAAKKWLATLPVPFAAKGRYGSYDIWGLIRKPRNFDPKKRYPVVEVIYAGPHQTSVPKSFSAYVKILS